MGTKVKRLVYALFWKSDYFAAFEIPCHSDDCRTLDWKEE